MSSSLLDSLLEYYKDRLDHHYIPKLQKDIERLRHKFPKSDNVCGEELNAPNTDCSSKSKIAEKWRLESTESASKALETLFAIFDNKHYSESERRHLLTSKAYEIRHLSSFRTYIHTYLGDSATEDFLSNIFFLGRIRAACQTFWICSRELSTFARMDICLILPPEISSRSIGSRFTLAQALQLAGLSCDFPTIQKHVSKKMQRKQQEEKFGHMQEQTLMNLRVHAEVQVLLAVQQTTEDLQNFFPYLGCSKLSCYLCSLLVQEYGFTTRGCHGRLYERWAVSNDSGLLVKPAARPRLVSALKNVLDGLVQIIRTPLGTTKPRVAESSAGCTVNTNTSRCYRDLEVEGTLGGIRWHDNRASRLEKALIKVFE